MWTHLLFLPKINGLRSSGISTLSLALTSRCQCSLHSSCAGTATLVVPVHLVLMPGQTGSAASAAARALAAAAIAAARPWCLRLCVGMRDLAELIYASVCTSRRTRNTKGPDLGRVETERQHLALTLPTSVVCAALHAVYRFFDWG